MEAECFRKHLLTKLSLPKQTEKDQSDDVKLDGSITLMSLDKIACYFDQAK